MNLPLKAIISLAGGLSKVALKSNKAAHDLDLPDVFIHLHDWNTKYRLTPAPRVVPKFKGLLPKLEITVYYLHLESNTTVEVKL